MPGQPPYPTVPHGQPGFPPPQAPQKKAGWRNPWVWVAILAIVVIGGGFAGCGSDDAGADASPAASSAVTTTPSRPPTTLAPPPIVPSPATTPPPVATTTTATPVNFAMPDVVGTDLQSAQDLIQAYGVFFSRSHDLLGSRAQVLDSNWMVCTQSVPAGQQVTGDVEGLIDLGVVKREESCP
jgi:hypothetical protein